MPPKKGKKKGATKKESGKKKKDSGETITFNEAVMTYQLEVKIKEMNEVKDDISDLKFRNERQKQRNQFLIKEQNQHMKTVLEQAHQMKQMENAKEKVPYEQVESALAEKLASIRVKEKEIEEQRSIISGFEKQIEEHSKALEQVKNYKKHGQYVDRTHIEVLNKEMEDMNQSYTEISEFFEKSLHTVKNTIMKKNEENIISQKKFASERAIQNLDKATETEIVDNKWLHREVEIHRKHIEGVEEEVEQLEKLNINVMSDMFEQRVNDANETKKFYLECQKANEMGSDNDSSEEDHCDMKSLTSCAKSNELKNENIKKVYAEEIIVKDGEIGHTDEEPLDWLDHHLMEFDELPTESEHKLGPMEIKLLCVYGRKMEIRTDDQNHDHATASKTFAKFNAERDELLRVR